MQVNLTNVSPVIVKAEVSVPWDQVRDDFQNAIKEVRKHASIPGFRKGKAPNNVIVKRYRGEIVQEMATGVIGRTMETWVKENNLKAVGQPRLNATDMKQNESFDYTVSLEVLPEIELKEWKGLKAESLNIKVTDEMVDAEIERMRREATTHEHVKDRAIEPADRVYGSLTAIDLAEDETLTDVEKYAVEAEGSNPHPFLRELVNGKDLDEVIETEYEAGEDDPMTEWRGKKVRIIFDINDAVRYTTPELDDAFAKTQDCDNVDALKKKAEADVLKREEEREENRVRAELLTNMHEEYDFPIPPSVVMEEARSLTEQQIMPYIQAFGPQGPPRDLIEQMMHAAYPQALAKVRTDLILEKIAETEGFEVSTEEMDKELESHLEYSKAANIDDLKAEYEEKGVMDMVDIMLKRRKAIDAIVEAAEITKVDELTKPEPEAEPEAEQAEADSAGQEKVGDVSEEKAEA